MDLLQERDRDCFPSFSCRWVSDAWWGLAPPFFLAISFLLSSFCSQTQSTEAAVPDPLFILSALALVVKCAQPIAPRCFLATLALFSLEFLFSYWSALT